MDKLFKAMADKNRRKILTLLKDQDMSVYEILKYFDITQATLSNHLSILRKSNLVKCTIKGKQRIYRLNKEVFLTFAENINKFAGINGNNIPQEIGIRGQVS
jgi:DNA-binding transcriptional ArsR family regulator